MKSMWPYVYIEKSTFIYSLEHEHINVILNEN